MNLRTALGAGLLALVGLAGGCDVGDPGTPPQPVPRSQGPDRLRAEAIFSTQACGLCHGDAGEGSDNGPPLYDLAPYWDVERLIAYLRDPPAFRRLHPDFDDRRATRYAVEMPAYDHLDDDELRALADWLMLRRR